MSILVEFKGNWYWALTNNLEEGGYALSPLEHCDDEGRLNPLVVLLGVVSYAFVFESGEVKRFNEVIGHIQDIHPVKKEEL